MNMRRLVKAVLPASASRLLGRWRLRYLESRLSTLEVHDAFDAVYKEQLWGGQNKPSGPGSYGTWAHEYVSYIHSFIAERSVKSVYDAGCGDFNVGSKIAARVPQYMGADISKIIVARNRRSYAHLPNVEFLQANICQDPIPRVDLITVRQVFQHLTNEQIEAALCNMEKACPRFVIVADHIMQIEKMERPNIDLDTHSHRTRVARQSGVVLSAPPFSRPYSLVKLIPGDASVPVPIDSVLAIYMAELTSDSD